MIKGITQLHKVAQILGLVGLRTQIQRLVLVVMVCLSATVHAVTPMLATTTSVGFSGGSTYALKSDGSLWSWGSNTYNQLGDGTSVDRITPIQIDTGYGSSVSAGLYATYALKADGSLWGWGQIPDLKASNAYLNATRPLKLGTDFIQVATNGQATAGIKRDGSLWAWGQNNQGQLGNGTTVSSWTPTQVGAGYKSISIGLYHTLAIRGDGSLWGWGQNASGQLGDGTTTQRNSPVQIGTGFKQVVAMPSGGYGIKDDGSLWAWGAVHTLKNYSNAVVPVKIGEGYARIIASQSHAFAYKADGSLWAWGSNQYGQLGFAPASNGETFNLPIKLNTDYVDVNAGIFYSVAIRPDGSLWTFGRNGSGQLGDGTVVDRTSPVQIASGFGATLTGTDCLFNWFETTYPAYISPGPQPTQTASFFVYRYYSDTRAFLAISTLTPSYVYYVGPLSGERVLELGTTDAWNATAACR